MIYLTISTKIKADQINKKLFDLAVPVPPPGQVTNSVYGIIDHPLTGEAALMMPQGLTVYVHPLADVTILDDLIGPELTVEELAIVHQELENAKGSHIDFTEKIPPSLLGRIKTYEQLVLDGWFDSQETP